MIWYSIIALLIGCAIAVLLYFYLERPLQSLLFLSKLVGKMAVILSLCQSALGRTQTRLLTAAQTRGWTCASEEEFARLQKRQVNLWERAAANTMAKKKRRGEPLFTTVDTSKTNNSNNPL
jgi:hypothetical protein